MGGRRFTNTPDLDEYIKCILTDFYPVVDNEKIEGEDAKFEYVMLALRTEKGLSAEDYSAAFGSDFFKDFSKPLERQKNYLAFENGYVRIREEYLYVQNTVIIDFLQQQQWKKRSVYAPFYLLVFSGRQNFARIGVYQHGIGVARAVGDRGVIKTFAVFIDEPYINFPRESSVLR